MARSADSVRKQVHETIDSLPADSLKELFQFLEFLQFKHRVQESGGVVALEGLWRDMDFDVTEAEVRALRQETSKRVLQRIT